MTHHIVAQPLTSTTIDTRYENFTQAYLDMGFSPDEAQYRGFERLQEDNETCFTLHACTNYSTAKATVWLLEAASMLCCGDFGNKEALRLIDKARESLTVNRG